ACRLGGAVIFSLRGPPRMLSRRSSRSFLIAFLLLAVLSPRGAELPAQTLDPEYADFEFVDLTGGIRFNADAWITRIRVNPEGRIVLGGKAGLLRVINEAENGLDPEPMLDLSAQVHPHQDGGMM